MAGKKENLKSLFQNTRTRVIIVFTAVILLIAILVGVVHVLRLGDKTSLSSDVRHAPSIRSIPGSQDPTLQYAKLQEQQNTDQAKSALKTGSSAIPTLVRSQTLGTDVTSVGSDNGQGGVGFSGLSREEEAGKQKSGWLNLLKNGACSSSAIHQVISEGGSMSIVKEACSCVEMKNSGYSLSELHSVCSCKELKTPDLTASQFKSAGFSAGELRECGFTACNLRAAGYDAQSMKDGGFSDGELKGAGYVEPEINMAGGIPEGMTVDDVRRGGCGKEALEKLHAAGVTASAIRRISGCSANDLIAGGYTPSDLKKAGFTAAEEKVGGVSPELLKQAGYSARELLDARLTPTQLNAAGLTKNAIEEAEKLPSSAKDALTIPNCNVETLSQARAKGVSASSIRKTLGCSAKALKDAGYSAEDLKNAGFTAAELKKAGFSAGDLKAAGFSAKDLKDAGFSPNDLKAAGFSKKDLEDAGIIEKAPVVTVSPPVPVVVPITVPPVPDHRTKAQQSAQAVESANSKQLQDIMDKQSQQLADQKYQQAISQRVSAMNSAANQALQLWKKTSTQVYIAGSPKVKKAGGGGNAAGSNQTTSNTLASISNDRSQKAIIKTGDILFAVVDTSVNSDEPSPILATIVSGKLKGSKLIGSFTLPQNASKMVISFNTMSVPGASRSVSISAFAIDANTARTALASNVNHHYMLRYGSLFASSFLEGIGNAFQSADTTVTVGGTAGGGTVTVQNGIDRSILQNAVIALGDVGQAWGQAAQQLFNTPITVEVYSGTSVGVLFTQDLMTL